MRGLDLNQLRAFMAIAETGSFAEAGRRLHRTPSAIAEQIKELEAGLSLRLVERIGRKAYPTPAGVELRRHAAALLQQADDVVDAMRAHGDGLLGHVRLATSATLAAYVMPAILARLRRDHPRLDVAVVAGSTRQTLQRLADDVVDLAFVNGRAPAPDPALEVQVTGETALIACYPAATPPPPGPVAPAALARKPFLFFAPGTATRDLVERWFRDAGCWPACAMEFDLGMSILALVDAGLGAAILPAEAAGPAAAMNVVVRPLDPPVATTTYIALRRTKARPDAIRIVAEALRAVEIDAPSAGARRRAA